VGIRELRADLAGFVRRAQTGERIVVSVSGQPVAALSPLQAAATSASVDDLVAAGLIIAPRRRGKFRRRDTVSVWAGTRIDRIVRSLRG
jgi:prevent-host-death family protein